jgi:hypothetical protein
MIRIYGNANIEEIKKVAMIIGRELQQKRGQK